MPSFWGLPRSSTPARLLQCPSDGTKAVFDTQPLLTQAMGKAGALLHWNSTMELWKPLEARLQNWGLDVWAQEYSKQAPNTQKSSFGSHTVICDRCQAGGTRVPPQQAPVDRGAQPQGLQSHPGTGGEGPGQSLLSGVALPTFYLCCLGVVQGPGVWQGIHHHPAIREGSSQQAQPAHLGVLGMDRWAQTRGQLSGALGNPSEALEQHSPSGLHWGAPRPHWGRTSCPTHSHSQQRWHRPAWLCWESCGGEFGHEDRGS